MPYDSIYIYHKLYGVKLFHCFRKFACSLKILAMRKMHSSILSMINDHYWMAILENLFAKGTHSQNFFASKISQYTVY